MVTITIDLLFLLLIASAIVFLIGLTIISIKVRKRWSDDPLSKMESLGYVLFGVGLWGMMYVRYAIH